MTELSNIYQDNIKIAFNRITKILDSITTSTTEKSPDLLNEADSHLKEAERLIKNLEIQSLTSENLRSDFNICLRNYKTGVENFKKRINKAKDNFNTSKNLDAILLTTDSSNQREKLIDNDEIAWKSFESLEKAKRSTIEMENISIEVSKQLYNQTDQIKGINKKVNDMNREITTSSGLLNKMMNLQRRNKVILLLFSLFFIFMFIAIFCFKFFGGSQSTSTKLDTK